MFTNDVITVEKLGKCYPVYSRPIDRLKQALWRGKKTFFEPFWALKDVSFSIQEGETLGIIGSNGSGKSTLLQLICNTLSPTTGFLEINGRVSALLELGAGFNPEFSGRENIYTSAAIMGLNRQEITACFDDIVDFSGIGPFIDQPVKHYSSGMYVRLAFATAIHVSPDILVVDEALAVGDIRFQQKCMARIKKFCQQGTVIIVSHDTQAILELCSRAIWLKDGAIEMDGAPKLVMEKYLQYMYEGDSSSNHTKPLPLTATASTVQEKEKYAHGLTTEPDPSSRQFGDGRVAITKVNIVSAGLTNSTIQSGRPCFIEATIMARSRLSQPIIGYIVKDRLGRPLFGDNTSLCGKKMPVLSAGKNYLITFHLDQWPNLASGEYVLSLAVANGTLDDHQQCHWVHDIVSFTSIPVREPGGMFSILDTRIDFTSLD